MADDNSINWQEINLVDDEASAQGTRALRFMIERIHQAQHNPSLRPTLQSLFRAHDLVLNENEQKEQLQRSVSPHGNSRAEQTPEWGRNRETDSPQRRSSDSPRPQRRPLERQQLSDYEGSSKRRRSSSTSRSSSPSRGRGKIEEGTASTQKKITFTFQFTFLI